jgi:hypothetical protein
MRIAVISSRNTVLLLYDGFWSAQEERQGNSGGEKHGYETTYKQRKGGEWGLALKLVEHIHRDIYWSITLKV